MGKAMLDRVHSSPRRCSDCYTSGGLFVGIHPSFMTAFSSLVLLRFLTLTAAGAFFYHDAFCIS